MKFYEFFQDENNYYLITEYQLARLTCARFCEGGNLFARLASLHTLVEAQVVNIMRQILTAVEYCHQRGIVHRYLGSKDANSDMKLENVLFSKEDINSTLKVVDFGRSKILRTSEKLVDLAGSV